MAFNASPNYPGSYLGVRAPNPPNVVYNSHIPTTRDWQNFNVGDIWIFTPAVGAPVGIRVFMLISIARNIGTWVEFTTASGDLFGLRGNDGADVTPDGLGYINIRADNSTVEFLSGVPNTLTFDFGITNLILGSNSLGITTAVNNVGLGDGALSALTTGQGNTAIGASSMILLTTASANTAVGFEALAATVTASGNSAFGYQALRDTNTGILNTAVGGGAGRDVTSGTGNVLIGELTGELIQGGTSNTAVGAAALRNAVSAADITAVGRLAGNAYTTNEARNIVIGANVPGIAGEADVIRIGQSNTTGIQITDAGRRFLHNHGTGGSNVFLGTDAGNFTNTGQANTGLGDSALEAITTGQFNTTVGAQSGVSITTGNFNTAVGTSALSTITIAVSNTAVGYNALQLSTADSNTAVGFGALAGTTTGDSNVAMGVQTLLNNTIGIGNVAVGNNTGGNITTGSVNTLLGRTVMGSLTTGSQNIAIGYLAGSSCTGGAESSNIYIGSDGGLESNTIRIGDDGGGAGQQNRAFIAGVYGVTPVLAPELVIIDAAGQLGSVGGGIPTATVIVLVSQALSSNTQYIVQGGPVNLSLPATSVAGDIIRIVGDNNDWTITQAAGQQINYGVFDSTLGVGGSLASSSSDDCVELMCMAANTRWRVFNSFGNLIVT